MNIMRWNPFEELDQVFDRYAWPVQSVLSKNGASWQPAVDIRETDDAYHVDVELPAVDPKDVGIELHGGVLQVSGERAWTQNDDTGHVHRSERRYGKFTRSFRLPEDADPESVRATAKDGVITIDIHKSAKSRPRTISVDVG